MRVKLIRKIPARKGLPYWFDEYEFECIECGNHYFRKKCDNRTTPYCCDCSRKHEKEKRIEYKARKEKNIITTELNNIKTEIEELKHHYPMGHDYELALNECVKVIDNHISGKAVNNANTNYREFESMGDL